jgi:hypothetical protein
LQIGVDATKFYPMSLAYDNQIPSDTLALHSFCQASTSFNNSSVLFSIPSINQRPRDKLKTIGQIKGNGNIYHDKENIFYWCIVTIGIGIGL